MFFSDVKVDSQKSGLSLMIDGVSARPALWPLRTVVYMLERRAHWLAWGYSHQYTPLGPTPPSGPQAWGHPPAQNSIHCPAGTAQSVARAVVNQTTPGSKPPGVVFELIKIARIQIGTFGEMQALICGPFRHQSYCSSVSCSSRNGRLSIATKRAVLRSGDSWPT